MIEKPRPIAETPAAGGFTLLDGVALVVGSAVASVHLRGLSDDRAGSSSTLFWISFLGISLTATGPIVFLARRFLRRSSGYPGLGDRLWAVLGLPWIIGAALPIPAHGRMTDRLELYSLAMILGLGTASCVAMRVIWTNWVVLSPGSVAVGREDSAWTDRFGLVVAIAWPLQCGFGLMILG